MEFSWTALLIVCPLLFLAGFVDSVAGGGGLISIPAYIFAGLPVINAYGTNHFSMSLGMGVSTFKFLKSGNAHLKTGVCSAAGAVVGSWLGAQIAMLVDEKILKYCLLFVLPVAAIFILVNHKFGTNADEHDTVKFLYPKAILIGLSLGAYDGFFGPGTGTFMIIAFCMILKLPIITAAGNAKMANVASGVGAAVTYTIGGKVIYWLVLPAVICTMAGNYLGARLAIKNGAKFMKPIIACVIVLLLGKIVLETFFPA